MIPFTWSSRRGKKQIESKKKKNSNSGCLKNHWERVGNSVLDDENVLLSWYTVNVFVKYHLMIYVLCHLKTVSKKTNKKKQEKKTKRTQIKLRKEISNKKNIHIVI